MYPKEERGRDVLSLATETEPSSYFERILAYLPIGCQLRKEDAAPKRRRAPDNAWFASTIGWVRGETDSWNCWWVDELSIARSRLPGMFSRSTRSLERISEEARSQNKPRPPLTTPSPHPPSHPPTLRCLVRSCRLDEKAVEVIRRKQRLLIILDGFDRVPPGEVGHQSPRLRRKPGLFQRGWTQ